MLSFNSNIIPKRKGAYIVGGSVRDILAQRVPNDYDFAVKEKPKEYAQEIAKKNNGHVIKLGKPGLTLYRVSSQVGIFDISPMVGNSIEEDLRGRDFTINSMAMEIATGKLIDPLNGLKDIENKQIRMVSEEAFHKDPIRLLRAYRIAAHFNFDIEPATSASILKNRQLINNSAAERIHSELIKTLETENSFKYLKSITSNRLLFEIIPELSSLEGCGQNKYHNFDVFDHTLSAYGHLEGLLSNSGRYLGTIEETAPKLNPKNGLIKFAILLHDIGKPATKTIDKGNIHFYNHERTGAEIAEKICDRIKTSIVEKKYISHIIKNHLRPLSLYSENKRKKVSKKTKVKFFVNCKNNTPDIILHAIADDMGKSGNYNGPSADFPSFARELIHDYYKNFIPVNTSLPLITGDDLIREFSLQPSPFFKTILDRVRGARLEGAITTKDEALDMIKVILKDTK